MNANAPITDLLGKWANGEKEALNEVIDLVYQELYTQAERAMARERSDHTLDPVALISLVYMRLDKLGKMHWPNRRAFFAFAATQMRRVLVDHARARRAGKRGGGEHLLVTLSQAELPREEPAIEALLLEQAFKHVEAEDPKLARLIELRYFSDMTQIEVADELGMSRATVQRKWTVALRLFAEVLT